MGDADMMKVYLEHNFFKNWNITVFEAQNQALLGGWVGPIYNLPINPFLHVWL